MVEGAPSTLAKTLTTVGLQLSVPVTSQADPEGVLTAGPASPPKESTHFLPEAPISGIEIYLSGLYCPLGPFTQASLSDTNGGPTVCFCPLCAFSYRPGMDRTPEMPSESSSLW